MHILVSGVRHRNAPISVRERFALAEPDVEAALAFFKTAPGIAEAAILTTCNRTEMYLVVDDTETGLQAVRQYYATVRGLDILPYRANMFTLLNEDASLHLFRVASGMDSLILGESQILGQVKEALARAQNSRCLGLMLDKLFKTALFIGKRVRTETGIASQDASVSRAAFEYAKQARPDLLDRPIALIGGGKMAEIIMTALKQEMTPEQQRNVAVINRSPNRLKSLTERYGFDGLPWESLMDGIQAADVLFVATGAPHIVFDQDTFAGVSHKLIIDISVPRNVDPAVGDLPDMTLVNTDALATYSGLSFERQQNLVAQAQLIIEEELLAFRQWQVALPARQTITRLRAKLERIRQEELAAAGLETPDDAILLEDWSRALVNKILHDPLVSLKASASAQEVQEQMAVLSRLFRLGGSSDASSVTP